MTRKPIGFCLVGLLALFFRFADGGAPPAAPTSDLSRLATIDARLRFGSDEPAGLLTAAYSPDASLTADELAERDFQAAMAELIRITLEHPGTEAADRAECVLRASEGALESRAAAKSKPFVFHSWVAIER